MYRAVALKVKDKFISTEDESTLYPLVSSLSIAFTTEGEETHILCDRKDITDAIRLPEISHLASDISQKKSVREALVQKQREMARGGGVILEGRDIGTVVSPDANIKFYLDAEIEERGRRRFNELTGKGIKVDFKETLEEVIHRDHNDMHRAHSPLKKADDAIVIDSTYRSVEEVVEEMVRIIEKKMGCLE
jgi:cytidylate kinase